MPHSIRTNILYHEVQNFLVFLKVNKLSNVMVGSYNKDVAIPGLPYGSGGQKCICYAYLNKDEETKEQLLFFTLKHGSLDVAYRSHLLGIGAK